MERTGPSPGQSGTFNTQAALRVGRFPRVLPFPSRQGRAAAGEVLARSPVCPPPTRASRVGFATAARAGCGKAGSGCIAEPLEPEPLTWEPCQGQARHYRDHVHHLGVAAAMAIPLPARLAPALGLAPAPAPLVSRSRTCVRRNENPRHGETGADGPLRSGGVARWAANTSSDPWVAEVSDHAYIGTCYLSMATAATTAGTESHALPRRQGVASRSA